jgi:DNA-binding response OmpR family regulator
MNPMKPVILVIDDDKDMLQLVGLMLKRIDVETIPMADGALALEWLSSAEHLDMVIIDLMMPGLNGLEVIRRIRSSSKFDRIPVLILSARADPNSIRYGLDHGADGYVMKPYLANTLTTRVKMLLGQKHQVASAAKNVTS